MQVHKIWSESDNIKGSREFVSGSYSFPQHCMPYRLSVGAGLFTNHLWLVINTHEREWVMISTVPSVSSVHVELDGRLPSTAGRTDVTTKVWTGGLCLCLFATGLKKTRAEGKKMSRKKLWRIRKAGKTLKFWRFVCLLWIDKARAKDKRYIWVSVWWKTTI